MPASDGSVQPPKGPTNFGSTLTLAGQALVVVFAFSGGIWTTAIWTAGQESKFTNLDYRITMVEKITSSSAPQENRIGRIEYRLDQLEKMYIEERTVRREFETAIKKLLDETIKAIIQMQATLDQKPARR